MTGHDPIEALADTLDALDIHLNRAETVVKRSEANRLSLLHIHAAAAVVIGPLFASIGVEGMYGSSWRVVRLIPGAPYSLAAVLAVGGVILGVATWYRHKPAELVGLALLLTWYILIAVSFGLASLLWLADGSRAGPRPSFYACMVYGHLAVIMAVHMRTLRRMRRGPR